MGGEWDTAQRIAQFRDRNGRWPSPATGTEEERSLGLWLRLQRLALARGTIDPFRAVCLNMVLNGWAPGPEEAWLEHAREASSFMLSTSRHPDPESTDPGELSVAMWLGMQRTRERLGRLEPGRRQWLDGHCPLWRGDGADGAESPKVGHAE
ncbi:hypothetical protein [Sinomonas gamaensis]|uniref:hypothetical protein n=1 Tax=Sinomonas gamaensis TaxID=2565624 RepID=UPI001107D281|nr:hypothetical protein [Sinomonas gamaensis]